MEIPKQQPYQGDSEYMDLLNQEIEERQEQIRSLQAEISALEQARDNHLDISSE